MRIRPGRTRSLLAGIVMLVVMIGGLVMMGRSGGPPRGLLAPFIVLWVIIGLTGATMAFYNAFSKEGLPLYKIDVQENQDDDGDGSGPFCPQCGKRVGKGDAFCRHCGASLEASRRG